MSLSLWQIFKPVLIVGLISAVGLCSALLADGFWDVLSWGCLALVSSMAVFYSLRRQG